MRLKMKQEDLAEKTGLPRSVISSHETGRRRPSKYHIQRYNIVFECDITNFVPTNSRETMVTKTIRLPPALYSQLQKEAEDNEMEVSKYIRSLLEKGVHEDYITKSMDTLVILLQEAIGRELKKQQNKEIPISLLQITFMIRYLMRDSLHLSSIELQEIVNDARDMARDEFYRSKGKGD